MSATFFYPTLTNVLFIFSTFFYFLTFFLIFISTFITSMKLTTNRTSGGRALLAAAVVSTCYNLDDCSSCRSRQHAIPHLVHVNYNASALSDVRHKLSAVFFLGILPRSAAADLGFYKGGCQIHSIGAPEIERRRRRGGWGGTPPEIFVFLIAAASSARSPLVRFVVSFIDVTNVEIKI